MNVAAVSAAMPALLQHAGVWQGEYQYVDLKGIVTDRHRSRVECVFPATGPYHYVQKNRFIWSDGNVRDSEFGGVLQGNQLVWDTDAFSGHAWTAEDAILLRLDRKDQPDTYFTEVIVLGDDGRSRGRTWHWFRNGTLYQRTLCNEVRV